MSPVAIVTGAAQGIGKAIAIRLAADGHDVVLNDLPSQAGKLQAVSDEIAQAAVGGGGGHPVRVRVYTADVSVEKDVESMVQYAVSELGGLDVMVANAGDAFGKSILSVSVDELDHILAVNVRGTFLCYKHAGAQMAAQKRGGRIIGASSIAGQSGFPGTSAYSASKFAIRGLTQSAAMDLGQYGITVNAYAPGPVETALMAKIGNDVSKELIERLMTSGPLATKGSTKDIASLVAYLASPESHFITGQTISANGGSYCA